MARGNVQVVEGRKMYFGVVVNGELSVQVASSTSELRGNVKPSPGHTGKWLLFALAEAPSAEYLSAAAARFNVKPGSGKPMVGTTPV